MRKGWRITLILVGIFLIAGHIVAQAACPALVQEALEGITTSCQSIGRNQACYGNLSIHATARSNTPTFSFDSVGDIIDVMELNTLKLDALDEAQGIWGLAMMQLQADIPETLPGQSVTFLLFGDVEIENRALEGQSPMQAFYMRSGVGEASCMGAPENGVLIQTPHGVQSVHFNINGVNVEIGSTVMLQAQAEGSLNIQTLEGAAVVTMDGNAYPVVAGTQMHVPLDANLEPTGLPSLINPLKEINFEALPLASLPRRIVPVAPLSQPAMTTLQTRLESGLDPCGVPGLPACEHSLTPEPDRVWATQPVIEVTPPTPEPTQPTESDDGTVLTSTPAPGEAPQEPTTESTSQPPSDVPPDQGSPGDPAVTDPVLPIVDEVLPVVDPVLPIVDEVLPVVDQVIPVSDGLPSGSEPPPPPPSEASDPQPPANDPPPPAGESAVTPPNEEAPPDNGHNHDHDKDKKDKEEKEDKDKKDKKDHE